ncbi:MAG: alpha/beta fold hydrolase [Actinobacteria bacterium]|nr:alpha/beta fold hydrolase [Actinomycetota bacterium]
MPPLWHAFLARPRRHRLAAAVAVLLLAAGGTAAALTAGGPVVRTLDVRIEVVDGPNHDEHASLDATLFVPAGVDAAHRAPAVVLAHGFRQTKDDVAENARDLAGRGYLVLTYTARGFGSSTGKIALDSPDYEVADAIGLIDWLARRPEVRLDRPGDPRVGVTGGSYGGALALLAAADDPRIDAIAPLITWNDLGRSLFPESITGAAPEDGVYKRSWAGLLFAAGASSGDVCGAFVPAVCQAYQQAARTSRATPELMALLHRSSPAGVLDRIHAPTLLVQGETDSLFPLSEADANARGIAAHGTPVKVVWYAGGHDAGGELAETDRLRGLVAGWFDHYLRGGPDPGTAFEYSRISPPRTSDSSAPRTRTVVAPAYPAEPARRSVPLAGPPQVALNPPGGNPAAISSLPGLGDVPALALSGLGRDLPGQLAAFQSAPLGASIEVVGAPRVDLTVASAGTEAVLFGKLYDVDTAGRAELPQRLVAPLRLTGLRPGEPATVHLTLPAIMHRFDTGHRLRLVLSTTDQAYGGPLEPAQYQISLAPGSQLSVPLVPGAPAASGLSPVWWLAGGLAVVALAALAGWQIGRRSRRRGVLARRPELAGTPLVITDLVKAYASGLVAVDGLSFRVERGQVCGLLGPNGAGKTTTLRVLMGLVLPTAGEVRVFGDTITPGAPVLARVGAFVEGPGFLPHLSGLENLTLYWRATGRPLAEAQLTEVLDVAGLGAAVHRRVRGYSHGMKQRLAIAQAMLGLPDLLVLDEPTNGLDPPQIRAMRDVLRGYAERGRTVVVSSHLLAEIEQTCSHVVVMNEGHLVAAGPVAELAGTGRLEDAFLRMLEQEPV